MIPAIVALYYWLPNPWGDPAACAAFALAGITDSLDGYSPANSGKPRAWERSWTRWPTS